MVYEKFKMVIKEELQKIYQESAKVEICEIQKNNGRSYDGIRITMRMDSHKPIQIIDLSDLCADYTKGKKMLEYV